MYKLNFKWLQVVVRYWTFFSLFLFCLYVIKTGNCDLVVICQLTKNYSATKNIQHSFDKKKLTTISIEKFEMPCINSGLSTQTVNLPITPQLHPARRNSLPLRHVHLRHIFCIVGINLNISYFRGMTTEEAQLEFVITTQKLDAYGDEYYPAKVSYPFILLL